MKDKQEESEKKQEEKRKYHFLKSREGDKKYNEADRKQFLKYLGLYLFGMVFMELIFHLFAYGELGNRIYMPLIFGIFWGVVFAFVTMLFRPKGRMILGGAIFLFVWFIFSAQLVYYHIFGTHISLSLLGMGTDAVTSFWRELLLAMGDVWYQLLLMLVPFVVFLIFHTVRKPWKAAVFGWKQVLVCFVLCLVTYASSLGLLLIGDTSAYSCYDLYHSSAMSTDLSVKGLGVLTTARLEMKYVLFGDEDNLFEVLAKEGEQELSDTDIYNMIEIDFDQLAQNETDEDVKALHEYFASESPTEKNEYTGYFEGYNLIELCCESFSPEFIDKNLTPMLYQMYHNGFVFKNFYTPWESNTTNGEYTLCMGLFPDNSRSKSNGSMKASSDNYLPFCLGNMFRSIGASAYGYHNYEGYYYCRNYTYPNMGLEAQFAKDGMTFSNSWPSSDLEMMEQSVSDYVNDNQFFVHYMTFSGHYRYEKSSNAMVCLNWDKVADLEYSDKVKAYISCNLELEYALENLVQQLETAGVADRTVIALTTDHFPYGLTLEEYSELAGHEVDDDFGKYENAFILWTPSMEEKVVVDDPMCTVDILPTLLNLWGFEYDSRLLAGKDIFSDSSHVAILSNGSFITDKIRYNSSTGEVTYLVDESRVTDSYVDSWVEEVKRRFTISTAILNTDYYHSIAGYLDIGDVDVDTSDINSFNNTSKNPNAGMDRNRGGNQTYVPPENY